MDVLNATDLFTLKSLILHVNFISIKKNFEYFKALEGKVLIALKDFPQVSSLHNAPLSPTSWGCRLYSNWKN